LQHSDNLKSGFVLVTGAQGFVGLPLSAALVKLGYQVRGAVRGNFQDKEGQETLSVGDINGDTVWSEVLADVSVLIHLAARVHVMNEMTDDPLAEFRKINVEGTLNLARQAFKAGVSRFIYISSIKVNGEFTEPGRPFRADDAPQPMDPYGVSKREAEDGLRQLAEETGLEVVIIRPPLIYGLGVKANFLSMMRWLHKGIPLPLGSINNARSLVALDNLVDLIVTCIQHPAAANQTFLVSDGEDVSTTDLLKKTALAMGIKARLIPVPDILIKAGGKLLGKGDVVQRLCGNLQVDITKAQQLLGWAPPISVEEGLRRAVATIAQ
jgi:UDP-glucose 4-epimerase